MTEKKTNKIVKTIISILAGIGVSAVSFFALLLLLLLSPGKMLFLLLGVFFISVITFLVLWNILKTKKVYFLLLVPALCIAGGIAVIGYNSFIDKIPTVSEDRLYLHRYRPFGEDNLLAKPGGESGLKITGNLPVLDGATALYPVYAAFAQAVYPEGEYDIAEGPVLCGKTDQAYENLLEGKADIIFCAGPSQAQLKSFADRGLELKLIPVGKEAFVFFVNKENPVNNLTVENIRGIYSGKIKNWKTLNGKNQNIRAFQRPKNSGSQTMLEKIMGGEIIEEPRRENMSDGMGTVINAVAVYRNFSGAIGYSFLYFSTEMIKNNQIKLLSIDDIHPSRETIQGGSYPFSDYFYAVYVDDERKNENTEAFIQWILSGQGQEIVLKSGYTPIGN